MTITERLMQIRAALKDRHDGQANALYLLEQLITEQHLNALYPEAVFEGVYTDTMGRLKVKPVDPPKAKWSRTECKIECDCCEYEQTKTECTNLCSCCKVIE